MIEREEGKVINVWNSFGQGAIGFKFIVLYTKKVYIFLPSKTPFGEFSFPLGMAGLAKFNLFIPFPPIYFAKHHLLCSDLVAVIKAELLDKSHILLFFLTRILSTFASAATGLDSDGGDPYERLKTFPCKKFIF